MKRGADFAGERIVKVVKATDHNGVEYHEGRITDPLPFDTSKICAPGGIYVCRLQNVGRWINHYHEDAHGVYDVAFDDDEPVVEVGSDKLKAHSVVLSGFRTIWDDPELCLAAVRQDGLALQYVHEQPPELCLVAVQQTGFALKYVKAQTPEMCVAAVQQHECALQYVHEQPPELCLVAVQQNGFALEYVQEQTPEMCVAAVQQHGCALQYVHEQTPELCLVAVQQNGFALKYVKAQTPGLCVAAVQQHGCALQYVEEKTPELCLVAVQQNGFALEYVQEQTPEMCVAAVQQHECALQYVHEQTPELCLVAVQQNGFALEYVQEQTPELCVAAVQTTPSAIAAVRDHGPPSNFLWTDGTFPDADAQNRWLRRRETARCQYDEQDALEQIKRVLETGSIEAVFNHAADNAVFIHDNARADIMLRVKLVQSLVYTRDKRFTLHCIEKVYDVDPEHLLRWYLARCPDKTTNGRAPLNNAVVEATLRQM